MKDMKKAKVELLEMKSTLSEKENILEVINSRLDIVEEKMSELEGMSQIKHVEQKEPRKIKRASVRYRTTLSSIINKIGVPKEEKEKGEKEKNI